MWLCQSLIFDTNNFFQNNTVKMAADSTTGPDVDCKLLYLFLNFPISLFTLKLLRIVYY